MPIDRLQKLLLSMAKIFSSSSLCRYQHLLSQLKQLGHGSNSLIEIEKIIADRLSAEAMNASAEALTAEEAAVPAPEIPVKK